MDSIPKELLEKLKEEGDKPRELTSEERKEMRDGMALYEMVGSAPGWKIVREMLEARAFHTWVDPRETGSKKDWEWRELNAYHAADAAKQLLVTIQDMIDKALYLQKVASGEIKTRPMKL